MIPFSKYQGTGNDFIVLEREPLGNNSINQGVVRNLCNRHRGIGADGVLLVEPHPSEPSMVVYNADGSRAAMCGNGVRCVARHLTRRWSPRETESWAIQTDSGVHGCSVEGSDVEVSMRAASFDPMEISTNLGNTPLINAELRIDNENLVATAVSMGNPHLVLFDIEDDKQDRLAELISIDMRFTNGVNVGFARVDTESNMLYLRVFERGVGWTEACGTGACAAAAAAVKTGKVKGSEAIDVLLPGGTLKITIQEDNEPVLMQGTVHHVFDGMLPVWPEGESTGTRRRLSTR